MAERRMFSRSVIGSDLFLDLPLSAQALYFHLGMEADDDGFVGSPKRIQRSIRASDDDLKLLLAKRFILAFDSGVIVIRHWLISNYIQKDRYHQTIYQSEKKTLFLLSDKTYSDVLEPGAKPCIQSVSKMDTEVSLVKMSLGQTPLYPPKGERSESEADKPCLGSGAPENPSMTSESFEEFWTAYPRKISKAKARKAWDRLSPDPKLYQEIMDALNQAKQSFQWREESGRYIPAPHNWLSTESWKSVHSPSSTSTHDIDELERLSFFDLPDEL